jgi:hypothetical protein
MLTIALERWPELWTVRPVTATSNNERTIGAIMLRMNQQLVFGIGPSV